MDSSHPDGAAAAAALARIGTAQRELALLAMTRDEAAAAAAVRYDAAAAPLTAAIAADTELVESWCNANRPNKGKTIKLPTGDAGWRTKPAKVLYDGTPDELVTRIKAAHLPRFIRTKEEPDLPALKKADAKTLAKVGARVEPGDESFFVAPL